jgi:hypothetical protein
MLTKISRTSLGTLDCCPCEPAFAGRADRLHVSADVSVDRFLESAGFRRRFCVALVVSGEVARKVHGPSLLHPWSNDVVHEVTLDDGSTRVCELGRHARSPEFA